MTPDYATPHARRALQLLTLAAIFAGTGYCWFLLMPSATVTLLASILEIAGLVLGVIALFTWRRHERQLWRQVSGRNDGH